MENEAAPIIAMLISECCQVGLIIISKQLMAAGMSTFIFVSYSNALAAFILLPFSFFLHRSQIPQLNLSLLGWFFLFALTGYLAQMFGYTGIDYSSPTLASAMLNLVPGLTFLLAIILRMEKLNLKTLTCLAKVVGTIVSIAGAFVLTLYEGPPLFNRPPPLHAQKLSLLGEQTKWILGGFLLGIDCVMTASCVIINAIILKKYPAELLVVFFYCFFVAIQSVIVTFTVEKDLNAWSLKPTSRLLAILYSGFFGSAVQVGLSTWCLRRKGPVFVCMFKPLGVAIAAVAGVVFFGDTFYLGSLLGVIIIVLGFYSFMWGKAKEEKISRTSKFDDFPSPTQTVPLLDNNVEETVNSAA